MTSAWVMHGCSSASSRLSVSQPGHPNLQALADLSCIVELELLFQDSEANK